MFQGELNVATGNVEARLAALEAEVERLRGELAAQKEGAGWRKVIGTFANDPLYDKAMKYGRAYRESLRPGHRKKRKRNHGDSGH
jgi:hypothetical protein